MLNKSEQFKESARKESNLQYSLNLLINILGVTLVYVHVLSGYNGFQYLSFKIIFGVFVAIFFSLAASKSKMKVYEELSTYYRFVPNTNEYQEVKLTPKNKEDSVEAPSKIIELKRNN